MGYISSATTLYATAYLTEKGREYLFSRDRFDQSGNDLFKIETFCLGDPDSNYYAIDLDASKVLQTGEIPDVSGKNEDCIKGAKYKTQKVKLIYQGQIPPPSTTTTNSGMSTNVQYDTDQTNHLLTFTYQI